MNLYIVRLKSQDSGTSTINYSSDTSATNHSINAGATNHSTDRLEKVLNRVLAESFTDSAAFKPLKISGSEEFAAATSIAPTT